MSGDQWDEGLRGPKMSSTSGMTIFKYQMPVLEQFTMTLPEGAEILRVEDQGGMFWMWALVDTNKEDESREFIAVKTGAPVPDMGGREIRYIGFCAIFVQMELGLYMFEVMP